MEENHPQCEGERLKGEDKTSD